MVCLPGPQQNAAAAPVIVNVSAPSHVRKFEKFEVTFDISGSAAHNFLLPYDAAPPRGIDPRYEKYQGISVDAEFTPDDWKTIYRQPAFYYHYYQDGGLKPAWDGSLHEWYYPAGTAAWMVRFSPDREGTWHYRLRVLDAGGSAVSVIRSFAVHPSDRKGFLRVSKKDPRYFEFEDGTLFLSPGLEAAGRLEDPIKNNEPDLKEFQKNHIYWLRNWISRLYGAAWPQWIGGRNLYDGYLPRAGILPFHDPIQNRDVMTMFMTYPEGWFDACRIEDWNDFEAVKPHTTYKLRIQYWGHAIEGPRIAGHVDFGLVAKISESWHPNCQEPGTAAAITNYGKSTQGWDFLEGTWNSGSNYFMPRLYIGLENVISGQAHILSVSLREVLESDRYGPEILRQPSMQYELEWPDPELYAMDKYLELSEKYGMYLKLVLMDKNDPIYGKLNDDGTFVMNGETDNQDGFYGLGRILNKTRWLQRAWWRYLQARWGYSPNIHSWELTNEGDPQLVKHWEMTDEFGKFMHCGVFERHVEPGDGKKCNFEHPNRHMITTSFWHSFPAYSPKAGFGFWGNPKYPNVDYADVHAYISTSPAPRDDRKLMERDAAHYHLWHSREFAGWEMPFPVVRGEAGMVPFNSDTDDINGLGLQRDVSGVWYHNFVWSTIDSGALHEIYWYAEPHVYAAGSHDHRNVALAYHQFMDGIALNNGQYRDIAAEVTDSNVRIAGQKDTASGKAHFWVQNKNHTWKNVVDNKLLSPVSGFLRIGGFAPNRLYDLEWWDTHKATQQIISKEKLLSSAKGTLEISIPLITSDLAAKIKPASNDISATH